MVKYLFPIIVILLLVSTSFLGLSYHEEKDELLDNLAFYCYDEHDGSSKYEYYKEKLLNDYPDDSIEINVVVSNPVETTPTATGPMDSAWPMKCHDNRHTGRSPYSTAHITGLEKWRYRCGGGVDGGIVISDDGTIYFGDKAQNINAIYPNGTLKWKYKTDMWITSAPALAEDGTLYVGSWDRYMYALYSSNGTLLWKFNSGDAIASSPAIAGDGVIYFGTMGPGEDNGRIYAVNPDGTEKWHYDTSFWITSDAAIGDDGTIYIGSGDTYFYAMNPNGTLKWRFKTGHYIKGSSSIADDGTVYIGSWDDYLYALYPKNGTMKWRYKVGHGTETNPSIAEDGTIYVGGDKLWAIYPNGTKRWTFDLGEGRHIHKSDPAISADGTIYVGTNIWETSGGDIIAISPDGIENWRKKICDEWCDSSPCIGKDGTVYIGSQWLGRGYIHAFGPVESNTPPDAPTISGETNGKVWKEYWYALRAVDPDNNPVSFYIDWGDGTHTGWTSEKASGETYYYEHTWNKIRNFTIKVKAKDVLGEESDWGYLRVTMPKNVWHPWWMDRFPLLQRLMEWLLG